jgi:hydroxyacylglutathione hydrolase
MSLHIEAIPAFEDNYLWLVRDDANGTVAAVDPGDADAVDERLTERGWGLDWILVTHHHPDHIGGIRALKAATGCRVAAAAADAARIPDIDVAVSDGDRLRLGASEAVVLTTPGHTRAHISWWFADARALFCGDVIFSLGCGRINESDAATAWASLARLATLPADTLVYCAHEYTLANARWASAVLPGDPKLAARIPRLEAMRARGEPTVPMRLGDELASNPFLRATDPAVAARMGLDGANPAAVFAALRRHKDGFRG